MTEYSYDEKFFLMKYQKKTEQNNNDEAGLMQMVISYLVLIKIVEHFSQIEENLFVCFSGAERTTGIQGPISYS